MHISSVARWLIAPAHPALRRNGGLNRAQIIAVCAVLAAAVLAAAIPGFASWGNAMTLLRNVSVQGIFALGMAVVMIGRGIDLSQIAIAVVSAGIAAGLLLGGHTLLTSLCAALAVALACGACNAALVGYAKVPPFLATLASAFVFVGFARTSVLTSSVIILPSGDTAFGALNGNVMGVPVPFIIFLAAAVLLHVFLSHTILGRFIYAHGMNPATARLTGLPVMRLTVLGYLASALTGCLGGLLMVAATGIVDVQLAASPMVFEVMMIVMLGGVSLTGGRGSIAGVLAGVLAIGMLANAMTLSDFSPQLQNIIRGLVLLAAVLADRSTQLSSSRNSRERLPGAKT